MSQIFIIAQSTREIKIFATILHALRFIDFLSDHTFSTFLLAIEPILFLESCFSHLKTKM